MYRRTVEINKSHHLFLFGARGTGKTTLLQVLFKNRDDILRIDLLDLELEARYSKTPKLLVDEIQAAPGLKYILIDEIQKVPKLLDLIHQFIQKNGNRIIFILTGSSAKKLKQGGANLLAGRAFVYHLFPLSFLELGEHFNLNNYLQIGGLPEVYNFTDRKSQNKFLRAYALTYLKEEVWAEHLIKNLDPFRKFLELAAFANGEIINYSKLAKQVGADNKTIQAYFQILEATLVGFILEPYATSIRKRLIKAPKFYYFDLGVKRALEETLTVELVAGTYAYGRSFEHFIISQFIYLIKYLENDFSYSYLKTEAGVEVDFIIQKPNREVILIKIKSKSIITTDDAKALRGIALNIKNSTCYLLSQDPISRVVDDVHYLPWASGILEILDIKSA